MKYALIFVSLTTDKSGRQYACSKKRIIKEITAPRVSRLDYLKVVKRVCQRHSGIKTPNSYSRLTE